jgi:hypothetical protein
LQRIGGKRRRRRRRIEKRRGENGCKIEKTLK